MKHYIYAGPSWAYSSYPDDATDATNLSKEWNISCLDVSRRGSSISEQVNAIKKTNSDLPVIFLLNEPLKDLEYFTGYSMEQFVVSENWEEIRHNCTVSCYDMIDSLPNQVALIGSHCDVIAELTSSQVLEKSWQKWIAKQAGMQVTTKDKIVVRNEYSLKYCWGAEVIHKFLHENQHIKPCPSLLDAIMDIYFFWDELQKRNWFYNVHPNRIANVEFAKYTKDKVKDFLATRSHYGTLS